MMDFGDKILELDSEVVNRTGYTCAKTVAELNFSSIKSYVEILCGCHVFSVMDPFEADDIRRTCHNAIAAAFAIPRKLVQTASDTTTPSLDLYSLYKKEKNIGCAVQRFIERIVELRYEFYVEGKWREFVDKIANTWTEKDFEGLDGIPDMATNKGE